jgi:ferredoxin
MADPSLAWTTPGSPSSGICASGREPLLGGALRQKAVWVDWGRSRAIRQDGDTTERIQEAIDTCPVDCIHWVAYEELPSLRHQLDQQDIQPLGLPSPARRKRTLARRQPG